VVVVVVVVVRLSLPVAGLESTLSEPRSPPRDSARASPERAFDLVSAASRPSRVHTLELTIRSLEAQVESLKSEAEAATTRASHAEARNAEIEVRSPVSHSRACVVAVRM
jgi:hypothetical protein